MTSSRQVVARGCSCPLRASKQTRPLHTLSLLGAGRGSMLPRCVSANQQPVADHDDDEPMPRWARTLTSELRAELRAELRTELRTAVEISTEALAVAKESIAISEKTREMLGAVLEVAMHELYPRLGVQGAGAVLQSVDDVLQFVLPCRTLLTAAQNEQLYRDVLEAVTKNLQDKDTGFLNAVILLLKGEGMDEEAGQVEAVLHSGTGIQAVPLGGTGTEAKPEGLRIVLRCLQAVESRAKAKGLGDDIRQLFTYCNSTTQVRAELLKTTLFVRCAAATLLGSYTGVLEVDAGAGMGCEVDKGAEALRLRVGETKYSAGETDAGREQLRALFAVAAFTLDKVLAAATAASAASEVRAALVQLPRRFIMDGFCVYAGKASQQQRQRQKAVAEHGIVADSSVIGEGGLRSAVLQVHFHSARYGAL